MKIYIGSDHNGYQLREALVTYLRHAGHDVADEGDRRLDPDDDFPVFAARVVKDVLGNKDAVGILLCGSGQGMCMAANRFKGIRAALGYDHESVRSARNDDDANILCLPASTMRANTAHQLADLFLTTRFAGAPRFVRRINEMDNL